MATTEDGKLHDGFDGNGFRIYTIMDEGETRVYFQFTTTGAGDLSASVGGWMTVTETEKTIAVLQAALDVAKANAARKAAPAPCRLCERTYCPACSE